MTARSPRIGAADMREPVSVQRPSYVADAAGGNSTVWNTVIPLIYCRISNAGGAEPYSDSADGRKRTRETFLFTTWYRVDIVQTDRLWYAGKPWNIVQLNDPELLHKFLVIKAEAGVEQ